MSHAHVAPAWHDWPSPPPSENTHVVRWERHGLAGKARLVAGWARKIRWRRRRRSSGPRDSPRRCGGLGGRRVPPTPPPHDRRLRWSRSLTLHLVCPPRLPLDGASAEPPSRQRVRTEEGVARGPGEKERREVMLQTHYSVSTRVSKPNNLLVWCAAAHSLANKSIRETLCGQSRNYHILGMTCLIVGFHSCHFPVWKKHPFYSPVHLVSTSLVCIF